MDARYSRQVALPGFGDASQQRLRSARVLVIGAGGLGSTVIPSLAGAGVGQLGIVDDDRVELSNLHRQHIHGTADVGSSKARSAAESVAALTPDTEVTVIEERLTASNALDLFAGYDLVVDGSDNFPTRYLANDAAAISGIPVVWGAVSQYGGQAGVAWADRGPQYRDLFPVPPAAGSVLSCEAGGVLPTTVGVIGSLMATEAIKIITGVGTPLIGRVTIFDALTGAFRSLEYGRDPQGEPISQLIDYETFCGLAQAVTPTELAARADDFILLDVREPWEAEIASLPGGVLIPLASLEDAIAGLDATKPVVVYCHHGIRSAAARDLLTTRGFEATHLDGGIDAWSRQIDPGLARY
ncbi:MAG: molybdopterin biosynthesis protein MoeB [Rhodoglobus sp.]|nr:molybdopterin biosynthesis protein MoeB [Rhodoglobus sp.]